MIKSKANITTSASTPTEAFTARGRLCMWQ
jgi:hypothetical protein